MSRERARIRELNDSLRRSGTGGRILLTRGVTGLGAAFAVLAHRAVAGFDRFDDDNDPHGEHDFGAFELKGHRLFFKIDYYAHDMNTGSPDPADPAVTCRVLTIMLSEEY